MICTESGEIRAYLSTDVEFGAMFESGVVRYYYTIVCMNAY